LQEFFSDPAPGAVFTSTLPGRLAALVRLLADKPFFCGQKPTYADFSVYHHFDLCRRAEPAVFSSLPAVQRFLARVEALPGVRDYLQSRPEMVDIGVKPMLEPRENNTSVQIKMIPGKA